MNTVNTTDRLSTQQLLQHCTKVAQEIAGPHKSSVRLVGTDVMIQVQCPTEKIFTEIFNPLMRYRPKWITKARNWHDIFVNTFNYQ